MSAGEAVTCAVCGTRIAPVGGAWVDAFGVYGCASVEPHFHRPAVRVTP